MFLRGPQPVTRVTRRPVFEHFFWSHFLMAFWSQMVSPREPKIAQNPQKSCSRGFLESTLQKVTKKDAIWVPSRPQNIGFRMRGVSKIEKSPVPQNDLKMTSKCLQFWMLLAPYLTKSAFQQGIRKCLKICIKQMFKNDIQRDEYLARKRLQNRKNQSIGLKMCPKPPRQVPRHPKY